MNVLKHSGARQAWVSIGLEDGLILLVEDDGKGLGDQGRQGIGLASMRERAGARGYILKDSGRDDLLRAIRAVANGEAIFSPSVATRVLDFFSGQRP